MILDRFEAIRAEAMGITLSKIAAPKTEGLMERSTGFSKSGLRAIEDHLDAHPNCKVIVIDSLSRALSGADENSNSQVQPIMGAFSKLAKDRGLVVLVVHHIGKVKKQSETASGTYVPLDSSHIRGASALTQLPRVIIGVDPSYEKKRPTEDDGEDYDEDASSSDDDEQPRPRVVSWLKASMFPKSLPKPAGFKMDGNDGTGFKFTRRSPKRIRASSSATHGATSAYLS